MPEISTNPDTSPPKPSVLAQSSISGQAHPPALSPTLVQVKPARLLPHKPIARFVILAVLGVVVLTLLWSVLGMAGWIVGSRRGNRSLWLAGAVLMAVVLVKLLLVDRGHLGNLLGIASFIGYGLLATVVGYVAPVPPRGRASTSGEPA